MSRYPLIARVYIIAVIAGAAAMTAAVVIARWPLVLDNAALIVVLGASAAATEFFPIRLPRSNCITVTTVVYFFALVSLPAPDATVVAAFSGLLYTIFGHTARHRSLFNAGQYTLTVAVTALIFEQFSSHNGQVLSTGTDYLFLALAGIAYFATNTGLVSLVVALTQRLQFGYVWRSNYLNISLYYLGMLPAGCLLAVLWQDRPLMTPFAVALAVLIHRLFTVAITLEEQTNQALVALADIIDQRDNYTYNHCKTVATWCERIAHQLKLPDDEIEVLVRAARLHDIGKIGIPNEVLLKPGRLSACEWESMRRHPELGEHILRFFPRFREGLSLVRNHHERYDGQGYPDRLRGEEIPLAARILCVADSLSAMLDKRPYKSAKSIDEVMSELKRCSAEQFDPIVVGATLALLAGDRRSSDFLDQTAVEQPRLHILSAG